MEEKAHLHERIEGINEGGLSTSMSDSISELSMYDNNPADIGSEMFERSKDFALREDSMTKVVAIEDALDKIYEGTYGTCDVCGTEIPLERLDAIPYTTTCYRCKAGDEQIPRTQDRPVEEEVMEELYEHTYEDPSDHVGYDLEDSWQDVSRWFEHAEQAESGAYYGNNELAEEDRGYVEEVENIPYEIGDDGVIYQNFRGFDDESAPREMIDVGFQHNKDGDDSSPY